MGLLSFAGRVGKDAAVAVTGAAAAVSGAAYGAGTLWSTATRLMLVRLPYERGGDGGEPDAVSLTAPDERPATEGFGVSLRFW